jgi:hypothetical protein
MNRRVFWAIPVVFALILGAGSSIVTAQSADPALERLQNLGTVLKTRAVWTAAYSQEYIPSGMTIGEIVEGQVWVSWPDHALFASGEPVQRWMGLSGLDVRLLDLENQTCDDHFLTVKEWERIPLVAVLEPRKAIDRFRVEATGYSGLSLTPREPAGVDKVTIEIGDDGMPLKIVVHDPQGATSSFDFNDWHPPKTPPVGNCLPAPPQAIDCISDSD